MGSTVKQRYEIAALVLLILTYLAIGALYAVQTPAWQVPDEPAHYNYIAQLAQRGCCPVIEMGDYDQAYLTALTTARFDPSLTDRLSTVQYEDHQPPLYYLLAWPVFSASGGNLKALRLLSVMLGGGVVLMAWAVVRVLFPARPWFALTAAAFVAFVPQHVAMMAGVNNDSLAELCIGAVLLASVLYVRGGDGGLWRPHPALLGALVGAAGLTKTTAYFTLAVALAAVWLRWRRVGTQRAVSLLIACAWVIGVAVALNAPWWLRNVSVYGAPDITGWGAHDSVVIGQPRTDAWIAAHGLDGWVGRFARFTFNSFWGQFGWMAVPMPGAVYAALLAFSGIVLLGVGLAVARNFRQGEEVTPAQRDGAILLALTLLLTALQYLFYNLTFVQHQGRYLFPALISIGFAVALGLDGWIRPLGGRFAWPGWVRWIPAGVVWLGLAALDVYALLRVIVPALTVG